MRNNTRLRPLSLMLLTAIALGLALLASGCGLIGGDDADEPSDGTTATTNYRVLQAAMGTQINEQQQIASNVQRVFSTDTTRVFAVLVMQGVNVGDEITGRWFQLSVPDAAPAGNMVSEASVILGQENLNQEGASRVALDLGTSQNALPAGDWVLRVYVNGEFVRTLGFVISPLVASGSGNAQPTPVPTQANPQPTQPGQPEPTQPPVENTPVPETYEVQSGDTLTLIAEQFKAPEETAEQYVARLAELNQLEPGTILFVGQVLQLPGPP